LLLFFSYFSTKAQLTIRKILQFDYAVNRPIKNVKSCCSYYPLLYYSYWLVLEIRGRNIEFLLSLNIAPKFEDTKLKETCQLDLSGQK
jgi:hypothetical protein